MEYLPWVEKYRPTKINNIIGQDDTLEIMTNMINNRSMPHLIFYGNPGTGKTSTILNLAKKLYGKKRNIMMMKLDASDDRGITSVRSEIKPFAEKSIADESVVKLIILDEADAMTFEAQFALRRIMELHSNNTRFCLICNYENKIIPAIKSRCINFRFNPISNKYIKDKLIEISEKEKININEDSLKIISKLSNGDMRKGINLLQSISMKTKDIDEKTVYDAAGIPDLKIMNKFVKLLLNKEKSFNDVIKFSNKNILPEGYSLVNILNSITNILLKKIKKDERIIKFLSDMSDLEYNLSISTFNDIYLTALISIFKKN